jgi:hypothetical protein
LQAGGHRFDPGHVHQLFSDCKVLSRFASAPISQFWSRLCTNCARMGLLYRDCAHWSRQQNVSGYRCNFVGPTVELSQSFALHLQLHLGILLEDLRVALTKHLCHPLVGYPSGTQPRGIRGAKVVNPKVGNLCSPKSFSPNSLKCRLVHVRNPIARKQERPFTRNRHLRFECFNGERSERNLGDTVRSF